MREDHQNERPLILSLAFKRKCLARARLRRSDPDRSVGELNEGRPKLEIIRGVQICTRDVPGVQF